MDDNIRGLFIYESNPEDDTVIEFDDALVLIDEDSTTLDFDPETGEFIEIEDEGEDTLGF